MHQFQRSRKSKLTLRQQVMLKMGRDPSTKHVLQPVNMEVNTQQNELVAEEVNELNDRNDDNQIITTEPVEQEEEIVEIVRIDEGEHKDEDGEESVAPLSKAEKIQVISAQLDASGLTTFLEGRNQDSHRHITRCARLLYWSHWTKYKT